MKSPLPSILILTLFLVPASAAYSNEPNSAPNEAANPHGTILELFDLTEDRLRTALANAKTDEERMTLHEQLGGILIAQKAGQSAITQFEAAADLAARIGDATNEFRLRNLIGNTYLQMNNQSDAVIAFEHARQVSYDAQISTSDRFMIRKKLGIVHFSLSNFAQAADCSLEASMHIPSTAHRELLQTFYIMGLSYARIGQTQKARQYLQGSMRQFNLLHESSQNAKITIFPSPLLALAVLEAGLGNKKTALAHLRDARKILTAFQAKKADPITAEQQKLLATHKTRTKFMLTLTEDWIAKIKSGAKLEWDDFKHQGAKRSG